jgi:pilus assembly protein CpaE
MMNRSPRKTTIIAIVSAKGGVGKSLLATNLAVSLAHHHKRHTILVDACPGIGYADLLLDLKPTRHLAELLRVTDRVRGIEPRNLDLATTQHPASGLHLLAAPPLNNISHRDGFPALTSETVSQLLNALREHYEFVIVDCPSGLDDISTGAARIADIVFVVVTADAPTLRSTKRLFENVSDLAQGDSEQIKIVLNQSARKQSPSLKEIAQSMNRPYAAELPVDPKAVWENISQGQPCALYQNNGLGEAIRRLAKNVLNHI